MEEYKKRGVLRSDAELGASLYRAGFWFGWPGWRRVLCQGGLRKKGFLVRLGLGRERGASGVSCGRCDSDSDSVLAACFWLGRWVLFER